MTPISLQALASVTNTDPNDTSELALTARANARKSLLGVSQRDADNASPMDAQTAYNRDMQGTNGVLSGGTNAQWAPFFESVQETGDRTGKPTSIGGAPGLPDNNEYGSLPVSLRGLSPAQGSYGYDSFGLPNSVTTAKRGLLNPSPKAQDAERARRAAAQPSPWSLG